MRSPRPATCLPLGTALFLVLFATAYARAAAPPERSRPVEELIREAEAAVARLDFARARELWAEVYEIERSNVAICTLGELDERLERWAEAVVELSRCVGHMPAPRTKEERSLYERRHADLARARTRVGEVVFVPPPGVAGMLVSGRGLQHGSSRAYVPPGQHEATAVVEEGQVPRATVKVQAGESKPVPLASVKPAPAPEGRAQAPEGAPGPRAPGPAAPKGPPQGAARPGPDLRIVLTGTMASAGMLGASALCVQSARGHEQKATAAGHREGRLGTGGATPPPDASERTEHAAGAKLMRFLGTGALLAGATAGVGTLLYVVLPNDTQIGVGPLGVGVRARW